MRWQFKSAIALLCGAGILGLAVGEVPMQFGGAANLKKDTPDPVALVHNASVKNHLKLTAEQLHKVDAALWDLLKGVLEPAQYERLKQLDLQQRDFHAFDDPAVQEKLGLNGDQKDGMQVLLADCNKEVSAQLLIIKQSPKDAAAATEKIKALEHDTKLRCQEVLTPDQRRIWEDMIGEPFNVVWPAGGSSTGFKDFTIPIGPAAGDVKGGAKAKGAGAKGKKGGGG